MLPAVKRLPSPQSWLPQSVSLGCVDYRLHNSHDTIMAVTARCSAHDGLPFADPHTSPVFSTRLGLWIRFVNLTN